MTNRKQTSTDSTPYWKLLKDARWQRKRLMIGEPDLEFDDASDGFSCTDENSA